MTGAPTVPPQHRRPTVRPNLNGDCPLDLRTPPFALLCGARDDCARRAAWQAFSGSRRGRPCLGCHGCCINAVVGTPALWQPQVRPAPARHATRLGGEVLGSVSGRGYKPNGPLALVEYAYVAMYFVAIQTRTARSVGRVSLRRPHSRAPQSRRATINLTQQHSRTTHGRPRAWAREGIPGPPTPPNPDTQLTGPAKPAPQETPEECLK